VEELLMHGADRSSLDGDGKTALDRACERKNILDSSIASSVASEQRHVLDESVAREVTWESLIKERDSFKKIEAALKDPWEIVKSGDKRQIQYLFVVSPQFAAMVDQNGWSGLHYAVRSNPNEEAILTLIRYSPSVEGLTSHKNTLLHLAAANRHLRVLKELTRKMLEEFEINKGILVEPGLFPDGTPLAIILNRENSKKWTPLHNAARSSSNLEVIAFLLVNGANILARTIHGLTVMHLAACNETVDIIRFLLEKETDINVCDNAKLTPLHHAVKTNPQVAVVGILLDKGANVNAQDVNGETPLHLAVRKRDKNMVELLCVRGAKLTLQNKSGMTPLDIAAADGLREIVEVFAHKGSCQSDLEDNFYKALCLAAKAKHKEVIQVLIRCGAPILHKTSRVDTEWGFPCFSSSLDVKLSALGDMEKNSALIQAYDWNMLHIVVMSGRREVVKWFVENRKDLVDKCINCGDKNGWTPVHLAVIFGYQEILELLLAENNIQVKKQRDNFSMTPSHWAAIRSIKDELLTSLNRIFLPRNFIQGWFRSDDIKDENTRLHLLILFGNLREISRAITNEPAICNKINKANIDGATPLICAIYRGEKHLIELLIKHGADVNQEVTMKGKTFYPLHFVAELDRSDLIAFLLRDGRGTDRFARATYGTTALHWAAANGKSGAIDQLILGDEGQKLKYMEDGGKRIALHYAAMNGHLDAVKALVTSKNADIHGVSVSEEEFFVSASEEEFSMNVTLNDPCKTVDKQDAEGRTPLHWAVINGHEQVENFLLNCEPDRKVKDNTGKMAEEYRK
jgi:ankyrin repeat protein